MIRHARGESTQLDTAVPIGGFVRASRRKKQRCPCECGTVGICDEHRARLHGIRDAMVIEDRLKHGRRKTYQGRRLEQSPGVPTCTAQDCCEPREPGMDLCRACLGVE